MSKFKDTRTQTGHELAIITPGWRLIDLVINTFLFISIIHHGNTLSHSAAIKSRRNQRTIVDDKTSPPHPDSQHEQSIVGNDSSVSAVRSVACPWVKNTSVGSTNLR